MKIPPPPTITSAANLFTQHKFDEIYKAALTGSVSAVHAVKTNPKSQNTYCKKQHAYKVAVLSVMEAQPEVATTVVQDWMSQAMDALDHGVQLFLHGPFGAYKVVAIHGDLAETDNGKEFKVKGRWIDDLLSQVKAWKGVAA